MIYRRENFKSKLRNDGNCSSIDTQGFVVIMDDSISKQDVSPAEIKLVQAHFSDILLKILESSVKE